LVALDCVKFGAHHGCSLSFDFREQWLHYLEKVLELCDFRRVLFFLHKIVLEYVYVGDVLKAFKFLGGTHRHQLFKGLLDFVALGSGKHLKLLRLQNEVKTSNFTKIALQVESTILKEKNVFVSDRFFLW
jgi:hypothetical protein